MKNAAIKTGQWLKRNFGALLCGALAMVATWVAIEQSYRFGWSLGATDAGKQSMAMWMAIIDICTAALPIAAVTLFALRYRVAGYAFLAATIAYMLFSMTSQVGFALSEREAKAQTARAINRAIEGAQAERKRLIESQVRWNNETILRHGTSRTGRRTAVELTEKMIDKAGEVDISKIVVLPEDAQATGFASTGLVTDRTVKITLAIWAAVLVILAKPLFWGLASFFYHRARQRGRYSGDRSDGPCHGGEVIQFPAPTPADLRATSTTSPANRVADADHSGRRPASDDGRVPATPATMPATAGRMTKDELEIHLERYMLGKTKPSLRQIAKRAGRSYSTTWDALERIRRRAGRSGRLSERWPAVLQRFWKNRPA
jgi:hypothetical protein